MQEREHKLKQVMNIAQIQPQTQTHTHKGISCQHSNILYTKPNSNRKTKDITTPTIPQMYVYLYKETYTDGKHLQGPTHISKYIQASTSRGPHYKPKHMAKHFQGRIYTHTHHVCVHYNLITCDILSHMKMSRKFTAIRVAKTWMIMTRINQDSFN